MTASIKSIRKRLLECLDRSTLANLSQLDEPHKRGRERLIADLLINWTSDCDTAIQRVVDSAKLPQPKLGNYYD